MSQECLFDTFNHKTFKTLAMNKPCKSCVCCNWQHPPTLRIRLDGDVKVGGRHINTSSDQSPHLQYQHHHYHQYHQYLNSFKLTYHHWVTETRARTPSTKAVAACTWDSTSHVTKKHQNLSDKKTPKPFWNWATQQLSYSAALDLSLPLVFPFFYWSNGVSWWNGRYRLDTPHQQRRVCPAWGKASTEQTQGRGSKATYWLRNGKANQMVSNFVLHLHIYNCLINIYIYTTKYKYV